MQKSAEVIRSPQIIIHPDSIIINSRKLPGTRKYPKLHFIPREFEKHEHSGIISKAARKKISRAVCYLLYLSRAKVIPVGFRGQGLKFNICFITLTLPSRQVHDNIEIITKCLQPLLNYLRKHYSMARYIWRAEKQKNGNIHFHLLTDIWIPYFELRALWNKYLQNLGYVTRYREQQLAFFKNGFKLRQGIMKSWSHDSQYRAYNYGNQSDWNNPNSVDIHSVKKIRNVKSYICKYLTKNEKTEQHQVSIQFSTDIELYPIRSRLWSSSESLSSLEGARDDFDSLLQEEIEKIQASKKVNIIHSDYYSIIYVNVLILKQLHLNLLNEIWQTYINQSIFK